MFNLNKKIVLVAILALTLGLGALGVSATATPSASVVADPDGSYYVAVSWDGGVTNTISQTFYNEPVLDNSKTVINPDNSVTVTFDVDPDTYTGTAIEGAGSFTASIVPATLSKIEITTSATKLSYNVGEALDITGLVVTGTYSDGSTKVETISSGDVAGFDSSAAVTGQVLTVTANGKTTTYTVDIVAPVVIPVTPPTTGGGSTGGTGYIGGPLVFSAVATTTGQVLGTSTFAFRTTLKFGSRGLEVKELQNRLRAEGFFTYPVSTGYFGTLTSQAVKNYQKVMLLKVTGMTDLPTRNILNLSLGGYQKYVSLITEYLKLQIEIAKLSA